MKNIYKIIIFLSLIFLPFQTNAHVEHYNDLMNSSNKLKKSCDMSDEDNRFSFLNGYLTPRIKIIKFPLKLSKYQMIHSLKTLNPHKNFIYL